MQQLSYGSFGVLAVSSDLTQPPHNLRLNGAQVTDWIDVHASTAATPLARGNRKLTLTLRVPRFFSSHRLAQENFLTHFAALDAAGTITALCGITGDQSTKIADAVLQSAVPELLGYTVLWDYAFLVGPFTTPT